MFENGPDHRRVFNKTDDPHRPLTFRADQGIYFVYLLKAKLDVHNQPCRRPVCDQFETYLLRIWHSIGGGISPSDQADGMKTGYPGLTFCKTRCGRLQAENLERLGTDNTGEYHRFATNIASSNAALLVGDVAQRDVPPSLADPVKGLATVAGGIDIFYRGLLGEINRNSARFAKGQAHRLCKTYLA